jgi:hypothetical protein
MSTIILRGGVELENPLELALAFLDAYSRPEPDGSGLASFDECDLRLANGDGARISSMQIAAILERRRAIERALREIPADASLAGEARSIPWVELTALFEGFADIPGIGFSKMTKALHRKRPALIPMLDSFVQAYLTAGETRTRLPEPFAERAVELVRAYKRDLDENRVALRHLQRELGRRAYPLTEVRLLDLLIWSVEATKSHPA